MLESHLNKVAALKACENFKDSFFTKHLWKTASAIAKILGNSRPDILKSLITKNNFLSLGLEGEESLKYRCVCRPPCGKLYYNT